MGSVLGQLSDFDKNNVHSVLVDCSRSMPRNRSIYFVFFVYCCNKTIVVLKYVYDFFFLRVPCPAALDAVYMTLRQQAIATYLRL